MTATVPATPAHTATLDALRASLNTLITADDAYFAAALAGELSGPDVAALVHLREADDFLQQAAMGLAEGQGLASASVIMCFQFAVMKLVEFNAMLPEGQQGDLATDCFRRNKAREGRTVTPDPIIAGEPN